jgi:hypothetical protein
MRNEVEPGLWQLGIRTLFIGGGLIYLALKHALR